MGAWDLTPGNAPNLIREAIDLGETRCIESSSSPNQTTCGSRDSRYDEWEHLKRFCDELTGIRVEQTDGGVRNYSGVAEPRCAG